MDAAHRDLYLSMTGAEYQAYLDKLVEECEDTERCKVLDFATAQQRAEQNQKAEQAKAADWLEVPAAPKPSKFEFQDAAQFIDQPPMRWLIPGLLPQAELAVIYGASGSGKSFLAYDMAAAITRGAQWNGRQAIQGQVAYIAAEGGHGMMSRVKAYAARNGGLDDLPRMTKVAPNLMEREDPDQIVRVMQRSGPYAALIVDTLSRSHVGNENSGEDMGKVLKFCQLIHQATGALIILIHHSGKDEARGQRGWSGLRAAADCEIEVTKDKGGQRGWSTAKMKDGADDLLGAFSLARVPLGIDPQGVEISSCVVEHIAGPKQYTPAPRKRPKNNPLVVLKAMEAEFKGEAPTMEELFDEVAENIVCPRAGRRHEYFERAVQALADTETDKWLWRHPGDRVSLTSVATSEAFA